MDYNAQIVCYSIIGYHYLKFSLVFKTYIIFAELQDIPFGCGNCDICHSVLVKIFADDCNIYEEKFVKKGQPKSSWAAAQTIYFNCILFYRALLTLGLVVWWIKKQTCNGKNFTSMVTH